MNELEQRAQKHKRKRKGLFGTLNPDAGNVEHNIAMFNHVNTPAGGPSTNPCGPMAEEFVTESNSIQEMLELHYDDLPVEVCVKPAETPGYHFEYDQDEAEYKTETISYDFEVPKKDVVTFIIENMDPDDYDGDWENDSSDKVEKFVNDNFDLLFTKYQTTIEDAYRDDAIEKAATEHSNFNEEVENPDQYIIMAITHDGDRQYYNVSSVPHWVKKGKDATIFSDQSEARSVWFEIDKKPFKRVFIPVYDYKIMNEYFYNPIPSPFEEKTRQISYYDRVCKLMDKLARTVHVNHVESFPQICFEIQQVKGSASIFLHFLPVSSVSEFSFTINDETDKINCADEASAIEKITSIVKDAHFKTFDIQLDEDVSSKYQPGQKVLYHGKLSKIFEVEYNNEYGYDLLIENPDFDPNVYTGSDAWKYKRIWVGEDVELLEDIQSNLSEANYGGAFDVDPEQYFTKDDLDEFANEVIYEVSQATAVVLEVADLSISKNSITLELAVADSYSCSHTFIVDMRKIRQPKDLMKYVDQVAKVFTSDWLKYLEGCTSIEESVQLITCPTCGGEKFNDDTGLCIDCGYDDNYEDTSSFTFDNVRLHEQLYRGFKN